MEVDNVMYKQVQLAYFTIGNLDTEFYTHTHTHTHRLLQKNRNKRRYIDIYEEIFIGVGSCYGS